MKYWWLITGDEYPNYNHWERMKKGNYIALGWDLIKGLENFKTNTALKNSIKEQSEREYPKEPRGKNINKKLFCFVEETSPNDIVIVCQGLRVLGLCKISGQYYYEPHAADYKHRIPVEWLTFDTRDLSLKEEKHGHSNLSTFYKIDQEKYSVFIEKINQKIPNRENEGKRTSPLLNTFHPEFTGNYTYANNNKIEVNKLHGKIIQSLKIEFENRNYVVYNNKQIDLFFLFDSDSKVQALFEAKTDIKPYDIYCAIGQLLYHSHSLDYQPRIIIVLPDSPAKDTLKIFTKLNIHVLTYKHSDNEIIFTGLDNLLESLLIKI